MLQQGRRTPNRKHTLKNLEHLPNKSNFKPTLLPSLFFSASTRFRADPYEVEGPIWCPVVEFVDHAWILAWDRIRAQYTMPGVMRTINATRKNGWESHTRRLETLNSILLFAHGLLGGFARDTRGRNISPVNLGSIKTVECTQTANQSCSISNEHSFFLAKLTQPANFKR